MLRGTSELIQQSKDYYYFDHAYLFGNKHSPSKEIGEKVKKIVADHLGVEEEKVTDEASFIDDLGADSLDTVELVMAFEEEFGSEISDSEAEKILTVGDAIKFIESKSAQ